MTPDLDLQFSVKELTHLRRAAGRRLCEMREKAGLSQRDLAARLGMTFYTYVSTIEHGRSKVSVQQYYAWAAALEVDVRELVLTLMPYYDPITFRLLYGEDEWKRAVCGDCSQQSSRLATLVSSG
jgi:transcriptional regulator with XRE-family HTH domain